MTRLRWCSQSRPAAEYGGGSGRVSVPFTDLVQLSHIMDPVFLQPDGSADDHFFYNHYIR